MSLLGEIQSAAVEKGDLSVALRKAKILASRLKIDGFKDWVEHELNGYPDKAGLYCAGSQESGVGRTSNTPLKPESDNDRCPS